MTFSPSSPADVYSPLVPERRVTAPLGQMSTIDSPNETASSSNKAGFKLISDRPRTTSSQHQFENLNKPKTLNNGFKIYQIPSHIVEAVEFPEIEKMKEDVPDYEMFQPGQVYDDSFDDENDTVALIDDDYIGPVSIKNLDRMVSQLEKVKFVSLVLTLLLN